MPRYEYRCPNHGKFVDSQRADSLLCECGLTSRRIWGFQAATDFQPYYSPSFGQVITSRKHAKTLAKIASEEQFARTGLEAHYEVVDTHDDAAFGIDTAEKEHYAEETRRHVVNGAAWSEERKKELKAEKDRLRAEKDAQKVDA